MRRVRTREFTVVLFHKLSIFGNYSSPQDLYAMTLNVPGAIWFGWKQRRYDTSTAVKSPNQMMTRLRILIFYIFGNDQHFDLISYLFTCQSVCYAWSVTLIFIFYVVTCSSQVFTNPESTNLQKDCTKFSFICFSTR